MTISTTYRQCAEVKVREGSPEAATLFRAARDGRPHHLRIQLLPDGADFMEGNFFVEVGACEATRDGIVRTYYLHERIESTPAEVAS